MDDLISRKRLLRDIYFQEGRYPETHLLRMAIEEQPAVDAVKVVRCRNCKHRHTRPTCAGRPTDFYCADGER